VFQQRDHFGYEDDHWTSGTASHVEHGRIGSCRFPNDVASPSVDLLEIVPFGLDELR